jgi:hypothetical protein
MQWQQEKATATDNAVLLVATTFHSFDFLASFLLTKTQHFKIVHYYVHIINAPKDFLSVVDKNFGWKGEIPVAVLAVSSMM